MEITELGLWILLVVVLAGAVGQVVDTAVGMGFGVLSSAILIASGLNPALAVATVNLAKLGSGLFSGLSHWSFGNIRWRWVAPLALSGVLGGVAGALLLTQLSPDLARMWVPLVLLLLGLLLIRRFLAKGVSLRPIAGGSQEYALPATATLWQRLKAAPPSLPQGLRLSLVGSVAGVVNGLTGAFGPVATPSVLLLEKGHPRYAVGSVNFAEVFVAGAVFAVIVLRVHNTGFPWQLPLALVAGSALTAPLGAYLSRHLPPRALGLTIGVLLVSINLLAVARAVF